MNLEDLSPAYYLCAGKLRVELRVFANMAILEVTWVYDGEHAAEATIYYETYE